MSSGGTAIPGPGEGTPSLPNLQMVGQCIKDLSFESPGAPAGLETCCALAADVGLAAELAEESVAGAAVEEQAARIADPATSATNVRFNGGITRGWSRSEEQAANVPP